MIVEKIQRIRQYAIYVIGHYNAKQCQQNAAALTYMTLFAIVPVLTVLFSVLSIIPSFANLTDQVHDLIFANLLPDSGLEIKEYIVTFTQQARNLSWFGLLFLFATAYFMLRNIEKAFNNIWGVNRARAGISSFLNYWALLSLGPLFLGVGLALSTYLMSLKLLVDEYDQLGILNYLRFFPVLFSTCALTLIFVAVPNCRVPFKHAAIAALITALSFELLKAGFGLLMGFNGSVPVIYGAFATVPIFLMWIYISWMILLGGAVLVRGMTASGLAPTGKVYTDLVASVLILWRFYQAHQSGERVRTKDFWAQGIDVDQWQKLRDLLFDSKIIAGSSQEGFVLSRDLNTLSVSELARLCGRQKLACEAVSNLQEDWGAALAEHLDTFEQCFDDELGITLGELFQTKRQS